ncbi:hypothetical protein HNY73_007240 [Argiope bruennichi]|uniref:PiggyBac transposable element-derived protein domain-containing protein n=1 Tax=Argiope bruennichi TaxID=94029 RepID=A0A8T0FDV0_ARGBR|nr:hypothetical protein HNY73_007240 [Argiope bruennichi]
MSILFRDGSEIESDDETDTDIFDNVSGRSEDSETEQSHVDFEDDINDNADCETYSLARKTQRWPLTVFFSILNIAGINAQILYMSNGHSISSRRNFLRQLSNALTY